MLRLITLIPAVATLAFAVSFAPAATVAQAGNAATPAVTPTTVEPAEPAAQPNPLRSPAVAPPPKDLTTTPAPAGAVAIVDITKLAGELRWADDMAEHRRKDQEFAQQQIQQMQALLAKQFADRKAQIADQVTLPDKEAFLKAPNDPAAWDKLGVPKDRQQELIAALSNASQVVTRMQEQFTKALNERQAELNRQYRLILQSPARMVAEEMHFTLVVTIPNDTVLYCSPVIDITTKVVDKVIEQKPLPPSLPDMPAVSTAQPLAPVPALPPAPPPAAPTPN